MTIEELRVLKESEDRVEFKEAKHNYPFTGGSHTAVSDRRRCVLGYIVALANMGGGNFIMGMTDKVPRQVVGTDFAQGKTGELEDEIYKRLSILVRTEELYEGEKRVLIIHIPSRPIGILLKFEGVPLMRIGESLREMSDQEIFRILSEQEADFSAKICPNLHLSDLSVEAIEILKQKYAEKQANSGFLNLSNGQILSDLELIVEGKLNYAALILLGKKEVIHHFLPQAGVIVEYRPDDRIEYTARKEFQEALITEVDKVWGYLNQPLTNPQQHFQEGPYIIDIYSFNEKVVREALLNALTHRSYNINSEVMVKQYPDYIEISNAGGLPLGVNLDNILTVNSTPRSKRLAEILQKIGLVERSGQGVDKIFLNTILEGKPLPKYTADPYMVSLKLSAAIDQKFLLYLRQKCNPNKLNVFDLITLYKIKNGEWTNLLVSSVEKLHEMNLIFPGSAAGTYYLDKPYTQPLEETGESDPNWAVLVKYFTSSPKITILQAEKLFEGKLNRNQIKYWFEKLVETGRIARFGKGRGTTYSLEN